MVSSISVSICDASSHKASWSLHAQYMLDDVVLHSSSSESNVLNIILRILSSVSSYIRSSTLSHDSTEFIFLCVEKLFWIFQIFSLSILKSLEVRSRYFVRDQITHMHDIMY